MTIYDWLSGISLPIGWTTVPVRRLGRIINGGTPTSDRENWDGDVPFVTPPDLNSADGSEIGATERTLTEEGSAQSGVAPPGSVLVSSRAPVGHVGRVGGSAAFNQGCRAVAPHLQKVDPRYLAYALVAARPEMAARAQGTTFSELSTGNLASLPLPLPPMDEQRVICDYLDRERAQIAELIHRQERFVDQLRERRTAVVAHAVWRGLEAEPKLGPSRLDTAPEAPEHWLRRRNKDLLFERNDLSTTGEEELLTVSHITGITPRSHKNVTMFEAESTVGYRLVSSGDLVINTMWAWMGALGVSTWNGIVSPAYGVYSPRPGFNGDARYLDYLYRSYPYVTEMTRVSTGIRSNRLRLYPEVFLRMPVVVPPVNEQRRIADQLEGAVNRIDEIISKAQRHISLARERGAALISDAVTGQFDVRSARKVA